METKTKWLTVARDLVSLAVGTFGLVYSQLTGQVSVELVVVYAALLGVPGVLSLLEIKGKEPPKDSTTGSDKPSSHSRE